MRPLGQVGYVFEKSNAFHVRYYVYLNGKRKQRSAKLCDKDEGHPNKEALSVVELAQALIGKVNEANVINSKQKTHCCPICGNQCRYKGKFTKQGD